MRILLSATARAAAAAVAIVSVAASIASAQVSGKSPRLSGGGAPSFSPMAIGGGEVVVELLVSEQGGVQTIRPIRETPPFDAAVASAVRGWRFVAGTKETKGQSVPVAAPVLVAAVFAPPSSYGGATIATPPKTSGAPSGKAPRIGSLTPPAYPPNRVGDAVVLVEVELSKAGQAVAYKVMSQ